MIPAGRQSTLPPEHRGGDRHMATTLETRTENDTHSILVGYICWLFGFTGAHRFYFGKQISGTIWFFTGGLLGIGWLIDVLLVPGMHRRAERRYLAGACDYTLAWLLLTFMCVGIFGLHRFYLGKWVTGLIWLCSGGLLGIGFLYDLWTLNEQVHEANLRPCNSAA
jgi:TM2 domain-containing membrane protein YozV